MFKLTPCLLDLEPRKKKTTSPDRKPGRIAAVTREYARVNARVRIPAGFRVVVLRLPSSHLELSPDLRV